MKPTIEYDQAANNILKEVSMLRDKPAELATKALTEVGQAVKAHVETAAPVSDKSYGGRGAHIKDDVTFKVKRLKKGSGKYVSISGGKKTWAKWHVVNDGHMASNMKFIPGNHFVDKAVSMSESDIEAIVDSFLGDIVK